MKAFVIKNEKGCYFDLNEWDTHLNRAFIAPKNIINDLYKDLQKKKAKGDCEFNIVEITIAEGDLEQQLDKSEQELAFYQDEIKNRGTCGLCEKLENKQIKELKQQLAIREKALELACKDIKGTGLFAIIDEFESFEDVYIKSAEQKLNKDN